MHPHSQQTFFLPQPCAQKSSMIAAETYNLSHTLLNRSDSGFIFVPIRSMQYLAVIDGYDIWFVDSLAYAVNDNEGGRMITISWHIEKQQQRDSLNQPVPIQILFYHQEMTDIQRRLSGEFQRAMQQLDQRYRNQQIPDQGARIIALKPDIT